MNSDSWPLMHAEILLFDWRGPEFLLFYLLALLVAILWSVRRAARSMRNFGPSRDSHDVLENPYEMAYLAGGVPRAAQLTITRLLHLNLIQWRSKLGRAKIYRTSQMAPADIAAIERNLLVNIGDKGLRVNEVASQIQAHLWPIKTRLATLGLRPTENERFLAGLSAVAPLLVLLVAGGIKIFLGIHRDKPILFLAILCFITVMSILIVGARVGRLTKTGEVQLGHLRERQQTHRETSKSAERTELPAISESVALWGPVTLATLPLFTNIHGDLQKQTQHASANAGSGAGGCSSGCGGGGSGCGSGGGGCGGGGCGGCGG